VIQLASSESRNRQAWTMSSTSPIRDSGMLPRIWLRMKSGTTLRVASVSVGPGATAFTRMFLGPSSRARLCVMACMASLAIP